VFTPAIRLVIVAVCVYIGVARLVGGDHFGVVFLLGAGVFSIGHFRYGTVLFAHRAMRAGDLDRAEKLLKKIRHPELLSRQYRSYYHWIDGAIAGEEEDWERSRASLEAALSLGALRTSHNRSVVHWQLAAVLAEQGDEEGARAELEKARAEPHKPEVDGLIARLEDELGSDPVSAPGDRPSQSGLPGNGV